MDSAGKDFHKAELLSIPATILILLIAFGAFVAAVLPVVLALSAFVAAFGLVLATSHIFPIDQSALSVMLLIGLAVGVDYSLFYIRREREERAAGASAEAALRAAAATSGRSVLISGLTVMVAVAGMFLAGTGDFRGIAMGTILVVATSVLGSLTVLPALLSKLGDKLEKGRIPFLARKEKQTGDSRFWGVVVDAVLRRPIVSVVSATALLVLLALPLFRMHTIVPSYSDYPSSMPILQTFDRIQHAFPAGPTQAEVVVKTSDVGSPAFASAVGRFRTAALATHQVYNPITVQTMDAHTALISAPLAGDGGNKASTTAVATLRNRVVPATLAGAPGIEQVAVGGPTAWAVDYNATMRSHVGFVFAFVLALAFLLLLVTFRSVVIALKAIVLNLLSVGAAYGFIVAVFQWGWGEHILGFRSTHGITAWIPLFLFVVLFGLSMDYHVFILSRIREAVDQGASTDEAVSTSLKTTAGVITSAAIVMVFVFSIFGSLSQVSMKEIGTGLAFAVLLDATIVRAVLLPASMKLLGEWNWWLPRKLEWLPQISLEGCPPNNRLERSHQSPRKGRAAAHRGGPAVQRLVFGSLAPLVQLDIESTYELSGRRTAYRCFLGDRRRSAAMSQPERPHADSLEQPARLPCFRVEDRVDRLSGRLSREPRQRHRQLDDLRHLHRTSCRCKYPLDGSLRRQLLSHRPSPQDHGGSRSAAARMSRLASQPSRRRSQASPLQGPAASKTSSVEPTAAPCKRSSNMTTNRTPAPSRRPNAAATARARAPHARQRSPHSSGDQRI